MILVGDTFTEALKLIREDLKSIQAGHCNGETNLLRKGKLCRDCEIRSECFRIKAQEISILLAMGADDDEIFNEDD